MIVGFRGETELLETDSAIRAAEAVIEEEWTESDRTAKTEEEAIVTADSEELAQRDRWAAGVLDSQLTPPDVVAPDVEEEPETPTPSGWAYG